MNRHKLTIKDLYVKASGKLIIKGISLSVASGETHAVMGPNGSGKSTFVNAIMGNPDYKIVGMYQKKKVSSIKINNLEISQISPEKRAEAGVFLSFQNPIAIPGINVIDLLRQSYQELYNYRPKKTRLNIDIANLPMASKSRVGGISFADFVKLVHKYCNFLEIPFELMKRSIHDDFSGGEKKKIEMLQALVLRPIFLLLDEIDTGLDVDSLENVGKAAQILKRRHTGIILITHYRRILKYIRPDYVHVLIDGRIVKSGDKSLAKLIEKKGYELFK